MHSEANNPSSSFSARLSVLRSKLYVLQKNVSSLEERLDGLIFDLDGLVRLSASSANLSRHLPPPVSCLTMLERRRLLLQQTCAGIRSVQITLLANAAARVQFDDRPGFPLPPSVAALFQILKDDCGTQTDQMVGWKTVAYIKQALHKCTGWSFTDRAVKELVFRLRRKLEDHGEIPFLVQSRRNLGYRLALWRAGDL